MKDQDNHSSTSENALTPWLRILSLPVGMALIILFADPIVNLATKLAIEFQLRWIVAFGIIAFVIFFAVESIIP